MHIPFSGVFIQRHPWAGVLLGLVAAGMTGCLAVVFWIECGRYPGVREPEQLTVQTASLTEEAPKRWVTLRGGVWHCDRALQVGRRLRGGGRSREIDSTQIPVTDESLTKLIVVKFDGEVNPIAVAEKPVTGILTRETDRVWGGSLEPELKAMGNFETVLVIRAGASPMKALIGALLASAFFVGSMAFAWYFAKLWIRQRREREQVESDVLRYGPR